MFGHVLFRLPLLSLLWKKKESNNISELFTVSVYNVYFISLYGTSYILIQDFMPLFVLLPQDDHFAKLDDDIS